MAIFDISLPIAAGLAGWPGDTPYQLRWTCRKDEGATVNLGEITLSIHTGTHTDAPFHFDGMGAGIDSVDLEAYIGPAVVARVSVDRHSRIGIEDIEDAMGGLRLSDYPRLLLRTDAWRNHNQFPTEIPVIAPDVPAWLESQSVRLLGIDVPSVDPLDSKELANHHALGRARIAILESLYLAKTPAGPYELIALPLPLAGADGSPVRAVLRSLPK